MNLRDFYIVASKILDLLTSYDPTPLYQTLIDHLNNIRSTPTPELQTLVNQTVGLIEERNRKIEEDLDKIPHSAFMIERLSINNSVGLQASSRLHEILRSEAYIAPTSVTTLMQDISAIKIQLSTIIEQLNKFGIEYKFDDAVPLLSIECQGEYGVNTTKELKSRLEDIEHVTRAFARLSGDIDAFKDPSIVSLSKSSPLIIDIGNNLTNVITYISLGKALKWAMDRIEQQYKIRLTRAQLKKEKLTNSQLEEGWDKLQAHKTEDSEIKKFVASLVKESNSSEKTGDPETTKKDLIEAIKRLLNMIEKGARVNVYLPIGAQEEDGPEEASASEITVNIAYAYKKLENQEEKLKLLETGKPEAVDPSEDNQSAD